MYIRRQYTVRLDPEVAAQIEARAAERELSVNEWINRAILHALAAKSGSLKVKTETRYEL